MLIKEGDTVTVQYKRSLPNGALIDHDDHVEEISFMVGDQSVFAGLDRVVLGMSLNEEKDVVVRAEDAYGRFSQDLVRKIPRDLLPSRFVPEIGMMVSLKNQAGQVLPGIICEITAQHIVLDLNHPLADKDIHLHITITAIKH